MNEAGNKSTFDFDKVNGHLHQLAENISQPIKWLVSGFDYITEKSADLIVRKPQDGATNLSTAEQSYAAMVSGALGVYGLKKLFQSWLNANVINTLTKAKSVDELVEMNAKDYYTNQVEAAKQFALSLFGKTTEDSPCYKKLSEDLANLLERQHALLNTYPEDSYVQKGLVHLCLDSISIAGMVGAGAFALATSAKVLSRVYQDYTNTEAQEKASTQDTAPKLKVA